MAEKKFKLFKLTPVCDNNMSLPNKQPLQLGEGKNLRMSDLREDIGEIKQMLSSALGSGPF